MKLLTILVLSILTFGANTATADIESFQSLVAEACKQKDIEKIKSLTHTEGSHPILIDLDISKWETRFREEHPADTYSFGSVSFTPLAEAQEKWNPRTIAMLTEPRVMNGRTYLPNLSDLVGFISVTWLSQDGNSAGSNIHAVFNTPEGEIKFSVPKLKNG